MRELYDIERVVPHRGTMLLVDRLLAWDEDSVAVELRVPDEGPFCHADGVPAWVGVEYMAQSIAAWSGCRARAAGRAPSVGFLLGTRRYDSRVSWFRAGSVLRVEAIRELMGDNGLGMFRCRILGEGEELATANVSVYEPADAMAYLESTQE
ncbi:hotdog family protein [Pseudoxanthomonas sp.]|jgi:predicted hotdog family 3-hydroxylacyl-ACP dehydratase|uniref:hotdog family protein n=1 Tax=Pseudoxanthomonas sp. TaxID=1871049 RepID=UPI002E15D92A|nr:hotdog family protein [Pseudoxanthomonas sp.]